MDFPVFAHGYIILFSQIAINKTCKIERSMNTSCNIIYINLAETNKIR